MINSKALEYFLIPAEEGFFFDHKEMINIDLLNKRKCLFVFATNSAIEYGGAPIQSLMKKYHYNKAISIDYDNYANYAGGYYPDMKFPPEFNELIKINEKRKKYPSYNEALKDLLLIGDKLAKNGILVTIVSTNSIVFSFSAVREYPIIIMNNSMVNQFLGNVKNNLKYQYDQIKKKNKEFEKFSSLIPKELFVNDPNLELFHVSPNKNIKELTPRVTNKPLDDENLRIPRVSAAPDIDSCFRAVGFQDKIKNKPVKYYVYKLQLTDKHRIVKPSTKLVPDQNETNEYWVLDPVKVECLGYISITFDKDKNRYRFDSSNMK